MLQDVISIFTEYAQVLLAILLVTITGYAFSVGILKIIFTDQLTRSEYFSLGLAGWLLPAALMAFLAYYMRSTITSRLIPILLPILCFGSILFLPRFKPDLKPASQPIDFLLPLILFLTIPARLLFVKDLVLPSYFDSVEHYSRIQNILNSGSTTLFPTQIYYHIGYHIITAFTIITAKAPIGATMLITGQWLLAIMPIAVFFLIRRSTGSTTAGLFAVVLSAFGWYMPAHAADWGKYPALMSVGIIPFVMSLAYLRIDHNNLNFLQRLLLNVSLFTSIIASTVIHSRSLIIYILIVVAWIAASLIERLQGWIKIFSLMIICFGIAAEIFIIHQQNVLAILFDPYFNAGIAITMFVLCLSLFAWKANSQLASTFLVLILFLCGSIFIPIKGLGGYPDLTLLDRPFVELILYLPLTILGGLGLAGLLKIPFNRFAWQSWIGAVLISGVFIHAGMRYSFQASPCCILIGNDDVAAIAWMNLHIAKDARIGVAATTMDVLVSDRFEGLSGSDAGIWITPLINRNTIPVSYDADFDQQATLDSICAARIDYLYVGEMGYSFNRDILNSHPESYKNLLSMPAARVYQVTGCTH